MNNLKRVFVFGGGAVLLILLVGAGVYFFSGRAETNAETLADLAQARLYKEWDWAGAERSFQQARVNNTVHEIERDVIFGK